MEKTKGYSARNAHRPPAGSAVLNAQPLGMPSMELGKKQSSGGLEKVKYSWNSLRVTKHTHTHTYSSETPLVQTRHHE